MRKLTCTTNLAKGCLLGTELKVGTKLYPRGKIIGRDEISDLHKAGIKTIDVIQVGIRDLLANAATDKLTRVLAGNGLFIKPARLGHGHVHAKITGLLRYSATAVAEALAGQDDFSVAVRPNLSRVVPRISCAEVTTHPIILDVLVGKAIAAATPTLEILQFKPLLVTCALAGNATKGQVPAVAAAQAALADYGSTLNINPGPASTSTSNTDLLLLAVAAGVTLARAIAAVGAVPIPLPNSPAPDASWQCGTHGELPVIAIATELAQFPAQLLRLLDLVHAGLPLTAAPAALATPADHTAP